MVICCQHRRDNAQVCVCVCFAAPIPICLTIKPISVILLKRRGGELSSIPMQRWQEPDRDEQQTMHSSASPSVLFLAGCRDLLASDIANMGSVSWFPLLTREGVFPFLGSHSS